MFWCGERLDGLERQKALMSIFIFYWQDYLVHTLLISNALFLYTWYILPTRLFGAHTLRFPLFTCFVYFHCTLLTRLFVPHCTSAHLAYFTCFVSLYMLHFNDQVIKCIHCKSFSFHIYLYIWCILMTRLLSALSLAQFTCFVNVLCTLLARCLLQFLHSLTSHINDFYI